MVAEQAEGMQRLVAMNPDNRSRWSGTVGSGWFVAVLCVILSACTELHGDVLILKDGNLIEGKILEQIGRYVKIETRNGVQRVARKDIDRIIEESLEGSAMLAIQQMPYFDRLPDIARELKNAQALYDLERYSEIPDRVAPLVGKGSVFDEMRIRWLMVESHERMGQWAEATRLLEQTLEDGREPDRMRAQAHLDLFKENPGYTLRYVNGKRTLSFLTREMRLRGKKSNALQSRELMEAALVEYVEQILRHEEVSASALQEQLEIAETLEVIQEAVDRKARNVHRDLPYLDQLRKVETSIYKANAILPGFAVGYDIELVRVEADHLDTVLRRLVQIVSDAFPGRRNFPVDNETGMLTPEGRKERREACDNFLVVSRPVIELIEYMLGRVRPYPKEMRRVIKELEDTRERIEQMRQNMVRLRNSPRP